MNLVHPAIKESDLLVIERLAAALEKASSVDEIKDVRDRAMAIQLYARKKAGGLAAAQFAGRVVTDATMRLAELYAGESGATGQHRKLDSEQALPGKVAVARAADMDPAALSRLKPLVEAPKAEVKAASARIEARGEVVTPSALLREVTASSAAEDYDGDEWYTPPDVIERVRIVLGTIELDAASNAHAQKVVRAEKYFTAQNSALDKPWFGGCFVNPPYSTSLVQAFTSKFLAEIDAKRVASAVYLVNNCTDAGWCQSLLARFTVCFTRGRIAFCNRKGQAFATRQGQAIFFHGGQQARFAKVFGEIGTILRSV